MYRILLFVLIIVWASLSGCSRLQGFGSLSDGAAGSTELRQAAATARAEADALDAIADQQTQAVDGAQQLATTLGAPELVTGIIAGIGGLLIPSPIRKKKPAA